MTVTSFAIEGDRRGGTGRDKTANVSHNVDTLLPGPRRLSMLAGVDHVRVLRSTRLTVRRAVDLLRCASALCRTGR